MLSQSNTRKVFVATALSAATFLAANQANALTSLRLTSGASVATIADNGAGDLDATAGVIVFSGSVGSFTVNSTVGLSYPFQGSANAPLLDVSSVNASSGSAGTLTIEFSTNDFTGPLPTADAILDAGGTTNGLISFDSYIDTSNALFGTATQTGSLGTFSPTDFSGTDTSGVGLSTSSPYSATIVATIVHDDSTDNTSFGASYSIVPEPTSLALLGLGSLLVARRRRDR